MSRILAALILSAAGIFSFATVSSGGPCDHLRPGTYAYYECKAKHQLG